MVRLTWTPDGWRVTGYRTSFICLTFKKAYFFKKYEAEIDNDFILDYILND